MKRIRVKWLLGLHEWRDASRKDKRVALGAFALLLFALSLVIVQVWPQPKVTWSGVPVLTNEPADGTYQTGDVVRWVTPEVCQPSGRTIVTFKARQEFPQGTSDTPILDREFTVKPDMLPECVTDNPTALYLTGVLPSGTYTILLEACVPNRFGRECATFVGPTFTMERIALAEGATL